MLWIFWWESSKRLHARWSLWHDRHAKNFCSWSEAKWTRWINSYCEDWGVSTKFLYMPWIPSLILVFFYSFYRIILGMKCKRSSCDGKPILKPLSEVCFPFLTISSANALTRYYHNSLPAWKERTTLSVVVNGVGMKVVITFMPQYLLQ